jgi:hypothetical protein
MSGGASPSSKAHSPCHDALTGFADKPMTPMFDGLLMEWVAVRDAI